MKYDNKCHSYTLTLNNPYLKFQPQIHGYLQDYHLTYEEYTLYMSINRVWGYLSVASSIYGVDTLPYALTRTSRTQMIHTSMKYVLCIMDTTTTAQAVSKYDYT